MSASAWISTLTSSAGLGSEFPNGHDAYAVSVGVADGDEADEWDCRDSKGRL